MGGGPQFLFWMPSLVPKLNPPPPVHLELHLNETLLFYPASVVCFFPKQNKTKVFPSPDELVVAYSSDPLTGVPLNKIQLWRLRLYSGRRESRKKVQILPGSNTSVEQSLSLQNGSSNSLTPPRI